nr:hypothetical protein [Leptospirillum ferrooxidans]
MARLKQDEVFERSGYDERMKKARFLAWPTLVAVLQHGGRLDPNP